MTKHVTTLLQKEVSRKEFLSISGLAVASIFGFGTAIKLITGKSFDSVAGKHLDIGSAYGSSAYGGFKK